VFDRCQQLDRLSRDVHFISGLWAPRTFWSLISVDVDPFILICSPLAQKGER
jgi:hypothetical protein